jgi:hypothetical protein
LTPPPSSCVILSVRMANRLPLFLVLLQAFALQTRPLDFYRTKPLIDYLFSTFTTRKDFTGGFFLCPFHLAFAALLADALR